MPATAARFDLAALPLTRDPAAVRRRIESLEFILERCVTVPGLGTKIGLDGLVGLLPVVGDVITGAMGLYLVWEARNLGASRWLQARMLGNVALDTAVGLVPLAGDVLDFLFRSNSKNLRLLKRHMDRHHPATSLIEGASVRR